MIFKLLNKLTSWYFKNLILANQELTKNTLIGGQAQDLPFRNTLSILANDLSIPAAYRKTIQEYLYRTRKNLIKNQE